MPEHPDVAVIGGGIIGLTAAYFLARAGLSVELLDRGDLGREASWAGAGIIPPGDPDRARSPADKLRGIGAERFPELSAELRELTGIDNGYRRGGAIEFLSADDADVVEVWRTEGIAFERLSPADARRLEPLGAVEGDAYLLPGCAQVRNPRHLRALVGARTPRRRRGSRKARASPACGWRTAEPFARVGSCSRRARGAGRFCVSSGRRRRCSPCAGRSRCSAGRRRRAY